MESIVLKTGGMHCSSCSMLIEMTVQDLPGVRAAKADYGSGVTRVDFDPAAISVDRIVAAIVEAGYSAALAA
jgi:copper chaperone CopZ